MPTSDRPEPTSSDAELVRLRARVAELEAALQAAAGREQQALRAGDELRESARALATIFEHAPFGIVIGALDDSTLRVNRAFEQITGYSQAELSSRPWPEITPAEDYARELPLIAELLEGRRTSYVLAKRYIHKDGHSIPVAVTGLVVRDAQGAPQACVALVEDLSERLQAEEGRGYLAAILESTPDLVGYITLEGQLQYLNRAWRELAGLPDTVDLRTVDTSGWLPAWARQLVVEIGIPTAIRAGLWQGEVVIRGADGRELPARQTVLALRDRDGKVARLATVLHDLRDERRAAVERLALERKLLEAQRLESLGVLAAGIAHDFNNILTTILGNADLALSGGALDLGTRQNIEAVVAGANRAAELTRQMLAYAGKGQHLAQPTDLNRMLRGLEEPLRSSAGRRAQLQLTLSEPLPPVEADAAQLRRLLLNLMSNAGEAIEATRADGRIGVSTGLEELGRGELDRLIQGADLPPGPYVRLTVEDNGCGMDAATAARIFDPFFSTKFLGRGLGLAAVQGIVRVHMGALLVESAPQAGTRFSIWLPARRGEAPAAPA